MAAIWHITANARKQDCGCADWDQYSQKARAWVHKTFRCSRHA